MRVSESVCWNWASDSGETLRGGGVGNEFLTKFGNPHQCLQLELPHRFFGMLFLLRWET